MWLLIIRIYKKYGRVSIDFCGEVGGEKFRDLGFMLVFDYSVIL